jgi:secondary thiamine-phosphate synthase enzyme
MRLNEVFPWEHGKYRHAEGNSASHLKAITTGTSQTVFIDDGRLLLGRWQGIYFCEFDGPRKQRTCLVKFIRD